MKGRLWLKLKEFFASGDELDDEEARRAESRKGLTPFRKGNIVSLTALHPRDIVVLTPHQYQDARKGVDCLKQGQPVIVNLSEVVDTGVGEKIIDFMLGSIYTLEGNSEKIKDGIFLFTPREIAIVSNQQDTNSTKKIPI